MHLAGIILYQNFIKVGDIVIPEFRGLKYCQERVKELSDIFQTDNLDDLDLERIKIEKPLHYDKHTVLFSEIERGLSGNWVFPPNTANNPAASDEVETQRVLKELSLFYLCAQYILTSEMAVGKHEQKMVDDQRRYLNSRITDFIKAKKSYQKSHDISVLRNLAEGTRKLRLNFCSIESNFHSFRPLLFQIHQYIIYHQLQGKSDPIRADVNFFQNKLLTKVVIRPDETREIICKKINDCSARQLNKFFYDKRYIDFDDRLQPKYHNDVEKRTFIPPPEFEDYKDPIINLMKTIHAPNRAEKRTLSLEDIFVFLTPPRLPNPKHLCYLILCAEETILESLPGSDIYVSNRSLAHYCIVEYLLSNPDRWSSSRIAREIIFESLLYLLNTITFLPEINKGLREIRKDIVSHYYRDDNNTLLDCFHSNEFVSTFSNRLNAYKTGFKTIEGETSEPKIEFPELTQTQTSEMLGISQQAVCKLLKGTNKSVNTKTFMSAQNIGLSDKFLSGKTDHPGEQSNGLINPLIKYPDPRKKR